VSISNLQIRIEHKLCIRMHGVLFIIVIQQGHEFGSLLFVSVHLPRDPDVPQCPGVLGASSYDRPILGNSGIAPQVRIRPIAEITDIRFAQHRVPRIEVVGDLLESGLVVECSHRGRVEHPILDGIVHGSPSSDGRHIRIPVDLVDLLLKRVGIDI
jgi:hypothetical protein